MTVTDIKQRIRELSAKLDEPRYGNPKYGMERRAMTDALEALYARLVELLEDQIEPSLTFERLSLTNQQRCWRWHPRGGVQAWAPERWSNAMAGEAGEACNAIKKLNRIEDDIANIQVDPDGDLLATREEAIAKAGGEIADMVIYGDLLAQRVGLKLSDLVTAKFNATSEAYGFPERL